MAKKAVSIGMRVVVFPRHRGYEGTVIELAHNYADSPPSYAKVRFDAWWKRTRWVDADYVSHIDGIEP